MKFAAIKTSTDGAALSLEINDAEVGVVNAIRRAVLSHVPCAAINFVPTDDPDSGVTIHKNTSPLHNEMLGHRLSMVPICMDADALRRFAADTRAYEFRLRVKNEGQATLAVTTADIRVHDAEGAEVPRAVRDALFPADPLTRDHILLAKLKPSPYGDGNGDEIDLTARAVVRTGSEHARWCPVSACAHAMKIDPALAEAALAAKLEAYRAARRAEAAEAADAKGGAQATGARAGAEPSAEELEAVRRQFNALDAYRCFRRNAHGEPDQFTFRLESECGLPAAYIFFRAIRELRARVTALRRAVESRDAARVIIEALEGVPGMYHATLAGEGHTCGNLIQTCMFARYVRDASPDASELQFVGYHQPHPLENAVVLRLKLREGARSVEAVLAEGLAHVEELLLDAARGWVAASGLKVAAEEAL